MPERLRDDVLKLLDGGEAHCSFDDAVAGIVPGEIGRRFSHAPHTPWRLVEHLRLCQWDLLEFVRSPGHVSPTWPDGYWPEGDAPGDANPEAAFHRACDAFRLDAEAFRAIVADASRDLVEPIAHANGTTLLRNALVLSDHNAYHVGQLVALRRALGTFPAD